MTFIKKLTASSDSTLSFIDGSSSVVLDNTYKEYIFIFNNLHPSGDNGQFFQVNFRDGGSDYDATKTTTAFRTTHTEAGSGTSLAYQTNGDLAQSTSFQKLHFNVDGDNDSCLAGTLHLFNPSSTTFVKHFISDCVAVNPNPGADTFHVAGYCNTTTAIDGVQFKFDSDNIESGTIKLYGIKDS
jgi:hypothetical protein